MANANAVYYLIQAIKDDEERFDPDKAVGCKENKVYEKDLRFDYQYWMAIFPKVDTRDKASRRKNWTIKQLSKAINNDGGTEQIRKALTNPTSPFFRYVNAIAMYGDRGSGKGIIPIVCTDDFMNGFVEALGPASNKKHIESFRAERNWAIEAYYKRPPDEIGGRQFASVLVGLFLCNAFFGVGDYLQDAFELGPIDAGLKTIVRDSRPANLATGNEPARKNKAILQEVIFEENVLSSIMRDVQHTLSSYQPTTVGRSKGCTITVDDNERYASREHLIIEPREDNWLLKDTSINGTIIVRNEQAMFLSKGRVYDLPDKNHYEECESWQLQSGDIICLSPSLTGYRFDIVQEQYV